MQTGNLGEDAIFVSFAPFAIGLGLDAEALRDLILRLGKDVHKLLVNGFDLFRGELVIRILYHKETVVDRARIHRCAPLQT